MTVIHVDGTKYVVDGSKNLLHTCLSLKLDLPYFCWHPALGSVGSCRLCAVKKYHNDQDYHGSIIMACMTRAIDNICISIEDPEVKEFRRNILELLMINHPHDCPVCEEGGNCHLQDMLVMTGHYKRRYRFNKRTHYNQYLGPFISHEMNRCIVCYRCIRFYKDYAQGNDLGVYGIHNNIYFGRVKDGILENEFSGNLIEICPTGVFTDKTASKQYTRKWDLQFAPSICAHCSVGCNTSPGERYGNIVKIDNRYHGAINNYFLCDRGRFSYGYVNLLDRPRWPRALRPDHTLEFNTLEIVNQTTTILRNAKKIIGIGSARASLESNFALRELVGEENFYLGMTGSEQTRLSLILKILSKSGIYSPTLREIENYDVILVLGEDLTQTSPRLALSVRQAVKNKSQQEDNFDQNEKILAGLFLTNIDSTRLDDIALWKYYASPEEQARIGYAIAHLLDPNSQKVSLPITLSDQVNLIAKTLQQAKKSLIISGSNAGSVEIIKAAANIATALNNTSESEVGLILLPAEVNSIGLGLLSSNIKPLETAIEQCQNGEADTVLIMENDLYRIFSHNIMDEVLTNISNVIVIDHQNTKTSAKANIIFSAASFAESTGTVVNYEGRAQRFFKVYDPAYYNSSFQIKESWRWLHLLKCKLTKSNIKWLNIDHVIQACIKVCPKLKGIKDVCPDIKVRIHGQKIVRKSPQYSGGAAILANINVHEKAIPEDQDSMLTFSLEGTNNPFVERQHISFAWYPGWNSPQAWNKFQNKIGDTLRHGDPGQRLIQTKKDNNFSFFDSSLGSSNNETKILRIVPYYHLFGSEEMSQRTPVIQKCMPSTYIMFNIIDANQLGLRVKNIVELSIMNMVVRLPVNVSNNLSSGLIGLPLGFPGLPLCFNGEKIDYITNINHN
ncbi:MAG: NADH-quinone oxidoreductase subunit NuoG [Candidatus Dasytiphilus stammeri]